MNGVNNFVTDIMDQMVDKSIFTVTFMPMAKDLLGGGYMLQPKEGHRGKYSGSRVYHGDEFVEDMNALGIDVLKKQDRKYFFSTADTNLFLRFRVEVSESKLIAASAKKMFIRLHYLGGYTEYRMNKELENA